MRAEYQTSTPGDRRRFSDREQIQSGPCSYCGEPVWTYADVSPKDEPAAHKRCPARQRAAREGAAMSPQAWHSAFVLIVVFYGLLALALWLLL